MKAGGRLFAAVPLALALATPAAADAPPVQVHTWVSRTAAWVGDRITYLVELRSEPRVDVLLDDLASQRLRIEGGDIERVETERREAEDGAVVHRMRYVLVTYRVDAPQIRIAAIPVRYSTRRAGDAAPAGEITVPPLTVAVRSTLPGNAGQIALRIPPPRPPTALLRAAAPIGIGLILLATVPAAIWSLDLGRRLRRSLASHHARRARVRQREAFDQLTAFDPASDEARVEAFDRLDAFIRDHCEATTGIAAHSLTPAEIDAALASRDSGRSSLDGVQKLLAACERARYGADPPSADDWTAAMRDAERLLNPSGR